MTLLDTAPRRRGGRPRLAALLHDIDPDRAATEMGTVGEWADDAGIDVQVVTTGPMPDPRTLDGVVVFGSATSAYDDSIPWLAAELDLVARAIATATPVLGICFGGQLLARALGGTVRRAETGEFGWTRIESDDESTVPTGPWLEFHFDQFTVPPGGVELARTARASQAFVHGPHLGVQFHPEITTAGFDGWAESWRARGYDRTLPALGLDLDQMCAEVAARAEASRTASRRLFDAFWARAQATRSGSTVG